VGNKISCPVLALWSAEGGLQNWYADEGGPLKLWQTWADNVSGGPVAGGTSFRRSFPGIPQWLCRSLWSAATRLPPKTRRCLASDLPPVAKLCISASWSGSSEAAHEPRRHLIGRAETGRISTPAFGRFGHMFNAVVVGAAFRSFVTEAPP
jgi:hypothetical protein